MVDFKSHANLAFSALAENKNAVLTFQVETGTTVDPDTGNVEALASPVTVDAILHPDNKLAMDDVFQLGADIPGMRLRGRVLSPKTLPAGVGHLSSGHVEFLDGRRGTVRLYLPPANPYIGSDLGTKIYCLFQEGAT